MMEAVREDWSVGRRGECRNVANDLDGMIAKHSLLGRLKPRKFIEREVGLWNGLRITEIESLLAKVRNHFGRPKTEVVMRKNNCACEPQICRKKLPSESLALGPQWQICL